MHLVDCITSFIRDTTFVNSYLLSFTLSEKEITLKGKNLLPVGANSCHLE